MSAPDRKYPPQKCWTCRKATTGECSWSRRLIPVDGWVAIKGEWSYKILACPEYVDDGTGPKQRRGIGRALSESDKQDIAWYAREGLSTREIAAVMGIGKTTVAKWKQKGGRGG